MINKAEDYKNLLFKNEAQGGCRIDTCISCLFSNYLFRVIFENIVLRFVLRTYNVNITYCMKIENLFKKNSEYFFFISFAQLLIFLHFIL